MTIERTRLPRLFARHEGEEDSCAVKEGMVCPRAWDMYLEKHGVAVRGGAGLVVG